MLRRLKPGWATFVPAFYWSLTTVVRLLLVTLTHWKAIGREKVPRHGSLIVVSNHLSNADPGILAAGVLGRRIRFMAKIELFSGPLSPFIRLYGAFPVRRFEADIGALLAAERILKAGHAIGMFPEGTRSRERTFQPLHPGTALIALRSGATILPCAIVGTEVLEKPLRLIRRPPMSVRVGEPFAVEAVKRPSQEQIAEVSERISNAIRELLPDRYIGAYTGINEDPALAHGGDHPGE